jgi:hypothetical protein
MIKFIELLEDINRSAYLTWKRKNVTLRGIKELGASNNVWGSFGKGLYTVPLGNKSMAKEYGSVYFVVNAIPKKPKVVQGMNAAEIFRQQLVFDFCKAQNHDREYDVTFFENNTSMEAEMKKLGYDGFIIKGREMVNYTPENILYFKTENELEKYFTDKIA